MGDDVLLDEIEKALCLYDVPYSSMKEAAESGDVGWWPIWKEYANRRDELYSNAPEWLRSCVSLIRKLQEERDDHKAQREILRTACCESDRQRSEWHARALAAESTVQKLAEVLQELLNVEPMIHTAYTRWVEDGDARAAEIMDRWTSLTERASEALSVLPRRPGDE